MMEGACNGSHSHVRALRMSSLFEDLLLCNPWNLWIDLLVLS